MRGVRARVQSWLTGRTDRRAQSHPSGRADRRAQSHVIGVAILLTATMVSLGALTAGLGVAIDHSAATANADRVATDMESSLNPVAATGERTGHVSFTGGTLRTVSRTVRVFDESGEIYRNDVGGLVYATDGRRVAYVAGMISQGPATGARRVVPPPIAASDRLVLFGIADLNASGADTVTASASTTVPLRTTVTHRRQRLGDGQFRIAVETATPAVWERYFRSQDASVSRRDFDGDGVVSVIGHYPGTRSAYLVVHDLALEVGYE